MDFNINNWNISFQIGIHVKQHVTKNQTYSNIGAWMVVSWSGS